MSKVRTPSAAIGDQARAWRERMNLSTQDLADLTGYSRSAIYKFEKGEGPEGALSEWSWQRYRLVCSGVAHQLRTGKEFSW